MTPREQVLCEMVGGIQKREGEMTEYRAGESPPSFLSFSHPTPLLGRPYLVMLLQLELKKRENGERMDTLLLFSPLFILLEKKAVV